MIILMEQEIKQLLKNLKVKVELKSGIYSIKTTLKDKNYAQNYKKERNKIPNIGLNGPILSWLH